MTEAHGQRWIWILILLGLGLRAWHFLREPSLWHDEAALVLNVIELDYPQMLSGKLTHHEAAPPLFLVIEKAMVDLFGDSLFVMRFLPFLVSCLALILFAHSALRLLPRFAAHWAVAFFAVSDRLLWHASEAKPYAFDLFLATLFLHLWERTRFQSTVRQCMQWMLLLPISIWLSFPACFLAGGVLMSLLPGIWQERKIRSTLAYLSLGIAVGLSFFLLATGPAKTQRDGAMEGCWVAQFANWQKPWTIPHWSFFSTLEVVRYNLMPIGHFLIGFLWVGGCWLYRRGERSLLLLLLTPVVAVYAAALMNKYPYGGSRIIAFLAPATMVLLSAGIQPTFDWLRSYSRRWIPLTVIFLLIPMGFTAYRTVKTWPRADCGAASESVLKQMQSTDRIEINHWEFEYYFRGYPFHELVPHQIQWQPDQRIWVVLAGAKHDREPILQALDQYGIREETAEFEQAAVIRYRGR